MRESERYATLYYDEIEKRYRQAIIDGHRDLAVILMLDSRQGTERSVADKADAPMLGVVVKVGTRQKVAKEVDAMQPGNIAATTLATETPPEGTFPLIVIMDEGQTNTRIDFLYAAEPTDLAKPARTYGQRVYRGTRERTEVEYLRAIKRGVIDPVIMVDTRDQDERAERLTRDRPKPEGMEMAHVAITIGTRGRIADEVAKLSRDAAKWLAEGPIPDRPFTVVVIGASTAEVFNEPVPEAGEVE